MPNPGEKKTVHIILENCEKIPEAMKDHIKEILNPDPKNANLLNKLSSLINNLDKLLIQEGYDPSKIKW